MNLASPKKSLMKSQLERLDQLTSRRNSRVYILPNKQGYFFLLSTFVLFNIGNIYGNNIVLLLSFLMISLSVVSMILTHLNMKHLTIDLINIRSQFADEKNHIQIKMTNESNRIIDDLNLEFGTNYNFKIELEKIAKRKSDNKPLLISPGRGYYPIDKIKLSTRSPSQLFYAWKFLGNKIDFYIYPERSKAGFSQNIIKLVDQEHELSRDEFQTHKEYQRGLPSRNIDWKIYGKTDQLLWKEFNGSEVESYVFSFDDLEGSVEERLSLLAFFIDKVFQERQAWTLIINNETYGASSSYEHYKKCLEVLACY